MWARQVARACVAEGAGEKEESKEKEAEEYLDVV